MIFVQGVKMGRIPKLVKERALKELKEQQLKQHSTGEISTSATTTTTNTDAHGRDSTCSSMSDRSIENDDPNPMETGLNIVSFIVVFTFCKIIF